MSVFELEKSFERAERRLGGKSRKSTRRPRSDRGKSRLDPAVIDCLARLTGGQERPRMKVLLRELAAECDSHGLEAPSRASVYKLLASLPVATRRVADLPPAVQDALYNLDPATAVPEHQVAFYCFNYGAIAAVSFAAGLPWLALYQALRLPGYRARSRGLVEAVARARRIWR